MKSRKLMLTLVLTLVALLMFAISISAEVMQIKPEDIESIYANDTNTRKDAVNNLFDGNISSAGLYSNGDDWFGLVGDTLTIEFKYEIKITKILSYGVGNWTISSTVGYDSNGNATLSAQTNFNNSENADSPPPVETFEAGEGEEKLVKKLVITITSLKWTNNSDGGAKTHKFSELEIFHDHNHDYTINDGLIYPPTCATQGLAKMKCVCDAVAEVPVDATGNHSMIEKVVFRNGFTNDGYYGSVCQTCETQDSPITNIGPLFTSLGYSSSSYGDYSIQIGVMINYDAIELYNSLAEYPIEFGTVVASKLAHTEGNPLVLGEEGVMSASKAVVCKDVTNTGYYLINYKIIGFGESHVDTEFFLSLYAFDGNEIYYIGEGTTFDAITVSYSSITNK